MNTRRHRTWTTAAIITVAIGVPSFLLYRTIRQKQLDRDLIAAVVRHDATAVDELLQSGANVNAKQVEQIDVPFWKVMMARIQGSRYFPLGYRGPQSALWLVYGSPEVGPSRFAYSIRGLGFYKDSRLLPASTDSRSRARIISALLSHGASLEPRNQIGDQVLSFACVMNDADAVNLLLARGLDPNADGPLCATDLIVTDSMECIKALVEHGANINAEDTLGRTKLWSLFMGPYASPEKAAEELPYLLEHGAQVLAKDRNGQTVADEVVGCMAEWRRTGKAASWRQPVEMLLAATKRERGR